jgi:hypothetical protein
LLVDLREGQRTDFDASFVKRLRRNLAHRIGTVSEGGKETIQLRLNGTLQTGQQEGQNGREGELAVAREEMRLETGRLKKFL